MYLKKLEAFGFKSFADRTDFHFQPGLTGIVGPNGCGKSNVVDAFKWIFGSQSPKGLRGSEMKDVIFNGTQSRKPAGFAEVSVVFDNTDGFLDIDYSEVSITRRLFRSGESEYLINRQKCRLKDIRELFLDTGIGQTSYSILEQGKIDVLLQSSPAERRMIFEEAAGISKYRLKKAETLRALLRVEDNLSRLQDIIDEVEKQIRRVKTQAAKARKFKIYADRLKEQRVRLAIDEYTRSDGSKDDVADRLRAANFALAAYGLAEARLAAGVHDVTERREQHQEVLRARREECSLATTQRERVEERIAQLERQRAEAEGGREGKERDLAATVESLDELRASLEVDRGKLEELRADLATRRDRLEELEYRSEECIDAERRLEESVREAKASVVGLLQRRARVTNQLVQVASELKNLSARSERLESALSGFRFQSDELRAHRERAAADLSRCEEEARGVAEEHASLTASLASVREEIDALERRFAERQEAIHRKSSRLDVLRSLEERLDGVTSGVAEVLHRVDELPELARPLGLVASLLRVDRRVALAIEAALGDGSQALVVGDHEGALALLEFARREGLGGLRIIALDRVDEVDREFFPRQGGVLGSLRDEVRVAPAYEELFDRLLANVVLVEDLRTAVALSRNGLRPFRLATLAGELVEPWGGLSVAGKAEMGLISRRSEMDELEAELAELGAASDEIRGVLEERRAMAAELRTALAAIEARRIDLERRSVAVRGELGQHDRELERIAREIHVSSSELAEVAADIASRETERVAREEEEAAVDQEQASVEGVIRDREEALADASARSREAASAVLEAKLATTQGAQQEEGLARLLDERAKSVAARERHASEVRRDLDGLRERIAGLGTELAEAAVEVDAMREREADLGEDLAELELVDERLSEAERHVRREVERVRGGAAAARRDRESLQLQEQDERHRRQSIVERLDEQYGLDLHALLDRREELERERSRLALDAIPASTEGAGGGGGAAVEVDSSTGEAPAVEGERVLVGREEGDDVDDIELMVVDESLGDDRFLIPQVDWDSERAREEIRDLQERMRRLGNVNLESLDEIDELETRYEFQKSQKDDLVESERKLRAIISDINRKSREMFQETFDRVQVHFAELFRKSFGGGKAELVLEEGADVLEAGIDIVARPPGKKLTSLSLMSGGERTMTTIALLLAIFRTRPSPFCILDEVDAPLDDANVARFIVLIKDFIEQSQFLVITHNKLTMAEASTLYGVTMQERGVSKRVAVELESYDPEAMMLASPEAGAVAD